MVRLALSAGRGCRLVSCSSGEQAQELVPAFEPDVILVDLMMPPGMDGLETVAALRQKMDLSSVSVVFASATDDATHLRRFKEAGAAGVIRKPFDALQLAERLTRIHQS